MTFITSCIFYNNNNNHNLIMTDFKTEIELKTEFTKEFDDNIITSDFDELLKKIDEKLQIGYIPTGNIMISYEEKNIPGTICKYKTIIKYVVSQKMEYTLQKDYTHSIIMTDSSRFEKSKKCKLIGEVISIPISTKTVGSIYKYKVPDKYMNVQLLIF